MSLWRNKFVLLLQNTSYETTAFIFVHSKSTSFLEYRNKAYFAFVKKYKIDLILHKEKKACLPAYLP